MYLNIWDFEDPNYPFQVVIGGRGCGKTYSALKGCLERKDKFILMRRTQKEIELLKDSYDFKEGANPFKAVNNDMGTNVGICTINKDLLGIFNRKEDEEGNLKPVGDPIGYCLALSTIATIRGVDFSDCKYIIFDEFIPEKHVRKMKNEGTASLNAYETINRNREFLGLPPIQFWFLANSNDIYNDLFVDLGVVHQIEKMMNKGQNNRYFKEKGLAIHLINNNGEFVEKKKHTALYKLTHGTSFYEMSLNNEFAYNDFSKIASRNIKGYTPICALDNAYVYKKKGQQLFYVSYAKSDCPKFSAKKENEKIYFMRTYGILIYNAFVKGGVEFETYELKRFVLDIVA